MDTRGCPRDTMGVPTDGREQHDNTAHTGKKGGGAGGAGGNNTRSIRKSQVIPGLGVGVKSSKPSLLGDGSLVGCMDASVSFFAGPTPGAFPFPYYIPPFYEGLSNYV